MAKAVIINEACRVNRIESTNSCNFKIVEDHRQVRINDILPFRVKFMPIGIEGVSPSLVPPIPLQVIGYSNYIL